MRVRAPARRAVRSAALRLAATSLCLAASVLVPLEIAAEHEPQPMREVRLLMGTTAEIAAAGLRDAAPVQAAFAAIARVDGLMSLWKESELSRLNREGEGTLSPETLEVVRHALEVALASRGAFDPTVEPLVRALGGFGGEPRRLSPAERRAILSLVGFRQVALDAGGRVRLPAGGGIDLGGIAKGYAADLALEVLRRAGARSALVDLGQSSVASFGVSVPVAIRSPDGSGEPWAAFVLRDAAVGTSGADQRGEHILDPRSGEPARRVLAATVVASRAIEADALSTAVFVLGAEEGLALAARRGAAAAVLVRSAGRPAIVTTAGFAERFDLQAAPGVSANPQTTQTP